MKKLTITILAIFIFLSATFSKSITPDDAIYLWKDVPSMKREKSVMYVHRPASDAPIEIAAKKIAVIICPGGSYHHLGLYNEGYKSAEWFSKNGITAFMLKYRSNEEFYNHPAMLEDIQRAIQLVRENADKYGIDKTKIGVIGYSAGGHLVTMAGEFGSTVNELEKLGITTTESLRPDFCIPVYPVVSMQDDIAHAWSRKSLLGKNPTQEMKDKFSMELNVPLDMPPTYLVVCKDDNVVDYTNSLRLDEALREKNVPNYEFHLYEWGKHGFGMLDNAFMKEFHWNEPLLDWILRITN